MTDNLTHYRKGTLWKTWCGLVPDQLEARIGELVDVDCPDCIAAREKMAQVDDTLERAECKLVGHVGHQYCGFCGEHEMPRCLCDCISPLLVPAHD